MKETEVEIVTAGGGYKESDVMFTLNTVEQHAVAHMKGGDEMKDVSTVVRRLTPL